MDNVFDAAKAAIEAGMAAGGAAIEALKDVLPENVLNLFRPELTRPPPRPPQSNEFEKLKNSNPELRGFVASINQAIDAYNNAKTSQPKIIALDRMMAVIKYFDVHTPPQTLAELNEFHYLKSDLFQQIKQAYAVNGVHSMAKEGSSPIADILSNMSQEYADKLMGILLQNKTPLNKQLNSLYDPKNKSPEANAWRQFLREHSIEFLGGRNSKNFKVINNDDYRVNVLKVDNRFNNSRSVEQHLREKHSDILTPIHADRQVKGKRPDSSKISRTLLVTDFCPLGSLDSYSINRQGTQKYLTTSILMGQMAEAFKGIQDANCIFTDAKPANWLIDSNGRIRIADTKSFLFTNKEGVYKRSVPGREYTGMTYSVGYIPSEMKQFLASRKQELNAEKVHASLLGRNIYQCLTGEWPFNFNSRTGECPDYFNFSLPIFGNSPGREYAELIRNLVQDPPEKRMSLEAAQKELQKLGIMSSPEYQQLMTKCEGLKCYTSLDLKSFVDNLLVLVKPEQALFKPIDVSLSQLKTLFVHFDELINFISSVNINGIPPISREQLVSLKNRAIQDATSIEDLIKKLEGFESSLAQNSPHYGLMIKYQKLKNDIGSLKFGDNDVQMQKYLKGCDAAICPNGKLDLTKLEEQIESMKKVKAGLTKPENKEVRIIIKKYDDKKTEWFSINMGAKARMIEDAMANIPIEERANLQGSKNQEEVKNLFKALAWHRINPFANPVDEKGNIVVSSSANTFKQFKNKFGITLDEEANQEQEPSKPKPS